MDFDCERIVHAVRAALRAHHCPCGRLSVALVDDVAMTDLHDRFMGIAEPTDVLTFDLRDGDFHHDGSAPEGGVDGEIVISVDTAARESAQRGRPVVDEVLLYAIHGTLHLLGYDDHDEADFERMHAHEDQLLTELGVGPVYGAPPN
jgi:probable rRNA maturation factor